VTERHVTYRLPHARLSKLFRMFYKEFQGWVGGFFGFPFSFRSFLFFLMECFFLLRKGCEDVKGLACRSIVPQNRAEHAPPQARSTTRAHCNAVHEVAVFRLGLRVTRVRVTGGADRLPLGAPCTGSRHRISLQYHLAMTNPSPRYRRRPSQSPD
jgi:hypothetical protein